MDPTWTRQRLTRHRSHWIWPTRFRGSSPTIQWRPPHLWNAFKFMVWAFLPWWIHNWEVGSGHSGHTKMGECIECIECIFEKKCQVTRSCLCLAFQVPFQLFLKTGPPWLSTGTSWFGQHLSAGFGNRTPSRGQCRQIFFHVCRQMWLEKPWKKQRGPLNKWCFFTTWSFHEIAIPECVAATAP